MMARGPAAWHDPGATRSRRVGGRVRALTDDRALLAVIDDDVSVLESLPDLVRESGYAARAYASAEEFLASGQIGDAQCLILDVRLRGMSGPDLQHELRRRGHQAPVIYITAQTDQALRERLVAGGAVACLFKPFREEELLEALRF